MIEAVFLKVGGSKSYYSATSSVFDSDGTGEMRVQKREVWIMRITCTPVKESLNYSILHAINKIFSFNFPKICILRVASF